jgi:hypothetical protein
MSVTTLLVGVGEEDRFPSGRRDRASLHTWAGAEAIEADRASPRDSTVGTGAIAVGRNSLEEYEGSQPLVGGDNLFQHPLDGRTIAAHGYGTPPRRPL